MFNLRGSRILVSGVSGPIGSALLPALKAGGAHISRLTRSRSKPQASSSHDSSNEESIPWDPQQPIPPETVSGFNAVVHLAGESIVGRWTNDKKSKIRDSRVEPTQHLAQALANTKDKPQVFVCSSAIGYYGDRADEVLPESSSAGAGFLPDVCREWESATQSATAAGIRTVQIRTGIVLSPKGGALGSMLPPFKFGLG